MKKFLVTGGCGFIGSHLCKALVFQGHQVRVLDNLSTGKTANLDVAVDLVVGDVADFATVQNAMQGVDGCFHLAAVASVERSIEDWSATHRTNLSGTVHVFDSARKTKIPVVYASSAAVYGDNASVPLEEDATPRPMSAYGADKLGGEYHARVAGLIHGIPSAGMRFFNVFGPKQDPKSPYSGVISIFIDRLLNQQPLTLFGDGQQVRDFVYVEDVVRFLLAGMENASVDGEVYNVCTGQTTAIRQLAQTLSLITSQTPVIDQHPPRGGDIQVSLGDIRKSQRDLGITAQTTLAEGLRHTVDFMASTSNQLAAQ